MSRWVFLVLFLASSCGAAQPPIAPLTDEEFQALSLQLSEPPGYFDTDNLISNEASYQHVIPRLAELAPKGEAYVGVGPDQNFSYLGVVEPAIAFVIDIRRDNLLQHLYFKSLFEIAETPDQYLSRLLGRRLPPHARERIGDPGWFPWLLQNLSEAPPDPAYFQETFECVWRGMRQRWPMLVEGADERTARGMAEAFFDAGLELKFSSHGRAPRAIYPTFGQLLMETDLRGRRHNFLSAPKSYAAVRAMQRENRIVPVVGDLAGDKALRGIGEYIRRRGRSVSTFYTSNVEFYLFANGTFDRYLANVKKLPSRSDSLFIRSYFNNWRDRHPESVPGYYVISLLQPIQRFLAADQAKPYRRYQDVVWMDYVPIATRPSDPEK